MENQDKVHFLSSFLMSAYTKAHGVMQKSKYIVIELLKNKSLEKSQHVNIAVKTISNGMNQMLIYVTYAKDAKKLTLTK